MISAGAHSLTNPSKSLRRNSNKFVMCADDLTLSWVAGQHRVWAGDGWMWGALVSRVLVGAAHFFWQWQIGRFPQAHLALGTVLLYSGDYHLRRDSAPPPEAGPGRV
jgi:hypothetical protein